MWDERGGCRLLGGMNTGTGGTAARSFTFWPQSPASGSSPSASPRCCGPSDCPRGASEPGALGHQSWSEEQAVILLLLTPNVALSDDLLEYRRDWISGWGAQLPLQLPECHPPPGRGRRPRSGWSLVAIVSFVGSHGR